MSCAVEKVISPTTGQSGWVIVDEESMRPVAEASEWVLFMQGAGRSPQTIRAYVPRVCWFLNWTAGRRLDWHEIRVGELTRFKFAVEHTPTVHYRLRSGRSVNAVMTAVVEFLRFCGMRGLVSADVVSGLSQPKYLAYAPRDFHEGESGQHRLIRARTLKAPEVVKPPEIITEEQFSHALNSANTERDRFLALLLVRSGLRIGEALGSRRSDLHFLPTSVHLGCQERGPHVHVVRREGNSNGARAKGQSRVVPVSDEVVTQYREYLLERDSVPTAMTSDFVFVNLLGHHAGSPMSYSNAKQIVERIGNRAGFRLRPHMFRHTAATIWTRNGTGIDVVQSLLGHVSRASTAIYQHPDAEDLRAAVERVGI